MNIIKKIIHYIMNYNKKIGGWVIDEPDERDYKFAEHFEKDIFGAVIPEEFQHPAESLPRTSNQRRTLSCLSNSFSFANAFYSKQQGNDVFLSWRFLYAKVPHVSGGTRFRDNAQVLKDYGQCLDQQMPQSEYYLSSNQHQEQKRINKEMYETAENYKILGYYYVRGHKESELKAAIMKSPVIIGVYSNNSSWKKDIITYNGYHQFGHSVIMFGWTKDYYLTTDWKGDGTIRKLDKNHPIPTAMVLLDKPDGDNKTMLKTVKTPSNSKIYLLLENGEKQHIASMEQYKEGIRKKLWKEFILMDKFVVDQYPNTKHPLTFEL